MKKILIISKYWSVKNGYFNMRLTKFGKYLKKKGYKVKAITSSNSLLSDYNKKKIFFSKKINDIKFYFIKDFKYQNNSFKRIISWFLFEIRLFIFNLKFLKFKPDIVYVSSLSLLTIINGIILKSRFKSKLIFEMKDLIPYYFYFSNKFSKYNPFILFLIIIENFGIKKSDLIISFAPKIRKYLAYKKIKHNNYHATTFPFFNNFNLNKKNNKFLYDKKKFNICYAGNFGYDNYLENIFSLISSKKNTTFDFHFIGNGSQKKYFYKKFSKHNNIYFHGHYDYFKLHSVLEKMDALILAFNMKSTYPTFGYELNKLNNYLMALKPIIIIGSKENLSKDRGKFIYVNKLDSDLFYKKINLLKKNYNYYLNIAKINKKKFLIRNNYKKLFSEIENRF